MNWDASRPQKRKPGRQPKYSDHAIQTAVTLGMVFRLASRQTEGLLRSLLSLLNLDLDVPDHTTISRRKAKLGRVSFCEDKPMTPVQHIWRARIPFTAQLAIRILYRESILLSYRVLGEKGLGASITLFTHSATSSSAHC